MPNTDFITTHPKRSSFIVGTMFLFGYWLLGFDGITFSDDVFYLLAGKNFWKGTMELDSYHFSTRWGAYVPSGLMGVILGFDPHRISATSFLAYVGTLAMLVKILPKSANSWVLVIWFSTQVYFLHFLTKVYPDSLLVFWTALVPFSAVFREKTPFLSALGVVSGLFFGFLTKETIVFLAPFPVLLFFLDWKKGKLNLRFYLSLLSIGFLFGAAYLAYFWIKFGDPFFRIGSINAGHYISEFTYADKPWTAMFWRLTGLPIVTFVERSYWLYFVFALPAFFKIRKNPSAAGLEMALAVICLFLGFWFMSSTLAFYNPLYLNPRHLIILVPILAFLVAYGWEEWQNNTVLKKWILTLILLGTLISLIQQDWKMAAFQLAALLLTLPKNTPYRTPTFGILLLIPALAAPIFHQKTKNYPLLVRTLEKELTASEEPQLILTHSFVNFSKGVIFPEAPEKQNRIVAFEKLDSLKKVEPEEFKTIVYLFYEKAYPEEQVDLDAMEPWLKANYEQIKEYEDGLIQVRTFRKN